MIDHDRYRIAPGSTVRLDKLDPDDDGGMDRREAKKALAPLPERLDELQELMYAENRHALLVVFQAMDAGGKDSTIRSVFGPLNPQGVRVWNFKKPSSLELSHDYLWRVHRRVPGRGYIGVFNRSHYEDVLVVRVRNFVDEAQWRRRYDQINDFERLLHEEGTTILKFYLHISRDYQKKRLQRRLDRPDKHWKFNPADLDERALWDDYRHAFEEAIGRCSTEHAPWYVIPSENRSFRNLLVSRIVAETLESLDMKYPAIDYDPSAITID